MSKSMTLDQQGLIDCPASAELICCIGLNKPKVLNFDGSIFFLDINKLAY